MKKNMFLGIACISLCIGLVGCGDSATKQTVNSGTDQKQVSEQKEEAKEPEVKGTWEIMTEKEFDFPVYNAGFYDKNVGMTVGYGGEIHVTTDGGAKWDEADNSSMCRFGLDFVDKDVCYTCGNGGDVTKSIDGGKTHEKVANFGESEPDQCTMLSFCDKDHGIIASGKLMAITGDGAKSWTELTPPAKIAGIRMKDSSTFYLVGSDLAFYSTTDAGKTWQHKAIKLPDNDDYVKDPQRFAISCDGDNAFTVYCIQKSTKKLKSFSTTDGWETLSENEMPEMKKSATLYLNSTGDILSLFDEKKSSVTALIRK